MRRRAFASAIALAVVLASAPAFAQKVGEAVDLTRRPVKEAKLDLAVPESPAFTVLGLTPQTVVRPTSIREFASSLLNGVDRNGNFQTGLALDTSPYMLLAGDELTIGTYRTDQVRRNLARTQLSLATAKGVTEDDKAVRLGLGLRASPWDESDPRMDTKLDACFDDAVKLPQGLSLAETEKFAAEQRVKLPALFEKCRKDSQARLWNASGLTVGLAPAWISWKGDVGDLRGDGLALWTSLAYGFEHIAKWAPELRMLKERAQVIVHVRYRADEHVPEDDAKSRFFTQDSTMVGSRLRFGGEALALSVEGAWVHANPNDRRSDDSSRLAAAIEFRVTKDVWFELSIGGETGRRSSGDTAFVLGSVKWGVSREPTLGVPRAD